MATIITDENFDEIVLKSAVPVLVDFFAQWCGPCQAMMPVIDQLSAELDGKVLIVKVDVDASMNTAQKYGIMSIPTFVFMKGGVEVDRLNGGTSKETLLEKLNGLI
ncbi:MAG: thioredoxin [Candidatus Gracilibacteria bacterium]|jgi:thioredoxin 1